MCVRRVGIARHAGGPVVLSATGGTVVGRRVRLVICPQKMPVGAGEYPLLPPMSALTDGDAISLFEGAIKALPPDTDWAQIHDWLALPIEQLPRPEAQRVLELHAESLKGVAQAARSHECRWPTLTAEAVRANLPGYRQLAFAVCLKACYEIALGSYEEAVLAMQTGFGLGRHLTQGPLLIQSFVGVAIAEMVRAQVEAFVQAGAAPNLYGALADLPKPFLEVEEAMERERKALSSGLWGVPAGEQIESYLKTCHDQARFFAARLDRNLAALQCVEAIRSYAASHGGGLPQALADIKEVSPPNDPMTGAAFRYTQTDAAAVLESPAPVGGDRKDELRYEITVKR